MKCIKCGEEIKSIFYKTIKEDNTHNNLVSPEKRVYCSDCHNK